MKCFVLLNFLNINRKLYKKLFFIIFVVNYFLVWVLILVIGTIILYFIVRNVLKTVVTFLFIFFLFAAITVTLTYSDIKGLKEDIQEREIVILVHDQHQYIFAFVQYHDPKSGEKVFKPVALSDAELMQGTAEKKYDSILALGNYYKVIFLDKSLFFVLPEEFVTDNNQKTTEELFAILANKELSFEDRAAAFDTILSAFQEQQGMLYAVEQLQAGTIIVYPKTMFFRILESLPLSWVEKLIPQK